VSYSPHSRFSQRYGMTDESKLACPAHLRYRNTQFVVLNPLAVTVC
jgi:hypothetical protein